MGEETIQNENQHVKNKLNQDSDEEKSNTDKEGQVKQRVTMERTGNQDERISYQSQSELEQQKKGKKQSKAMMIEDQQNESELRKSQSNQDDQYGEEYYNDEYDEEENKSEQFNKVMIIQKGKIKDVH